jgi:hypothetical protein
MLLDYGWNLDRSYAVYVKASAAQLLYRYAVYVRLQWHVLISARTSRAPAGQRQPADELARSACISPVIKSLV